jgi:hypothetical protein
VDYWVVDRRPDAGPKAFANYETDSRLLYMRTLPTGPSRAVMLDGRQVLVDGTPLINKAQPVHKLEWKLG